MLDRPQKRKPPSKNGNQNAESDATDASDMLFEPEFSPAAGTETSFVLSQLEVFNWGPFRGMHRAEFDPRGTAIIGPTGSGKTTLVDALMTLLVAQPRYNLASTGGHESDRTLVEYVRGVLGGDGADGRQEVARPGKTISGICATYSGGEQSVKLAGLFWTEGSGSAADDVKRRWVFSLASDQSFELWLKMLHEDGIRDLLKMGRTTANLRFFESKAPYLERVRKFFDVGANAFTLLNRAAGLKQLNSIDEIFRELVLDDRAAFDRAIEVAAEFDNLTAIHAELELAQKQRDSLLPVEEENKHLQKSQAKTNEWRLLQKTLPVWFARLAAQKWSERIEQLEQRLKELKLEMQKQVAKESEFKQFVDTLREKYLVLGGNVIGELENTISLLTKNRDERKQNACQYQQLVRRFELPDELTGSQFETNQKTLTERKTKETQQQERLYERALQSDSEMRQKEAIAVELSQTLNKVKQRPTSNIPPHFQEFRSELADQLSLRDGDLPYLAELVEIKAAEARWRGAIERAIGSERLRILVPQVHLTAALRWVNQRDNRLHVRLLEAREATIAESMSTLDQVASFDDGYVRKLNFGKHGLAHAAKKLLAERDLHCVASAEALKSVEHGLTVEGLISGRRGKFEKQDQRRLDQDWMTGFDNKDQLESLGRQLAEAQSSSREARKTYEQNKAQLNQADELLKTLDLLLQLDFSSIDLPTAAVELAKSVDRLASLQSPDSDVSHAKAEYESENRQLESLQVEIADLRLKIAQDETNETHARREQEKAQSRIDPKTTPAEFSLADRKLNIPSDTQAEDLNDVERKLARVVDEKLVSQIENDKAIETRLVRRMGIAKNVDTGSLTNVGTEVYEVTHYLERLRVLNEEALPEKRTRFLEYLNRSSDQGVTQLLASINEEVSAIEQRIAELNQTLVKVDFRSGRYLQLLPQRLTDERLRTLNVALQKVRHAALKDDGGESHFKALQDMVAILREAGENRRLQGSKALLDPRFRLNFFVVEVDRMTGDRSPPRSGSQSGSGGEKELMASHILTASLSYALCPPASTRPFYGTVILDEAFSKSSPSAASRIIEALRIFSLHPVFVTPNKEIGLLKKHTRKVICVQRPGKEASLASISWEKLEELARIR